VAKSEDYLIWLDLEMTGLEPDRSTILEIGSVLTDGKLAIVAEGPCFVIHHPDEVLIGMDPWCVEQHGKSGLTEKSRCSQVTIEQAELETLTFLQDYCYDRKSPLCGNSIGQDRRFLDKYMPRLNAFFHYRNVDVSSIKELVRRWYPQDLQAPDKKKSHNVMDDIKESIEELRWYRKTVFK
jgi:oligoribonuclease